MGLFDSFKNKSSVTQQAKGNWGLYPAIVEVGDSFVHLEGVAVS